MGPGPYGPLAHMANMANIGLSQYSTGPKSLAIQAQYKALLSPPSPPGQQGPGPQIALKWPKKGSKRGQKGVKNGPFLGPPSEQPFPDRPNRPLIRRPLGHIWGPAGPAGPEGPKRAQKGVQNWAKKGSKRVKKGSIFGPFLGPPFEGSGQTGPTGL